MNFCWRWRVELDLNLPGENHSAALLQPFHSSDVFNISNMKIKIKMGRIEHFALSNHQHLLRNVKILLCKEVNSKLLYNVSLVDPCGCDHMSLLFCLGPWFQEFMKACRQDQNHKGKSACKRIPTSSCFGSEKKKDSCEFFWVLNILPRVLIGLLTKLEKKLLTVVFFFLGGGVPP